MGYPESALREAVETGDRLGRAGDLKGARAAYERVIESAHPEWAPEAAIKLGDHFAARGARSLALKSYERAINLSGHEWAQVWLRIAEVFVSKSGRAEKGGRDSEAAAAPAAPERSVTAAGRDESTASVAAALKQVMDYGDRNWSAHAGVTLGNLLHEVGDRDGAVAAYKCAMESSYSEWSARAAVTLGDLLYAAGDKTGAMGAYENAMNFDDFAWSQRGFVKLWRVIFGKQRKMDAALRKLEAAMESDTDVDDERVDRALEKLEKVFLAAFKKEFTRNRGFPQLPPKMAFDMGEGLRKDGNLSEALAAYTMTIRAGDSPYLSTALIHRAGIRSLRNDIFGATADYRKAMATGHPEDAPAAAVILGAMLDRHGKPSEARAAYQYAINSENSYWSVQALVNLGHLLRVQGDIAGARDVFHAAINSGPPDTAAEARKLLNALEQQD